MIGIDEVFRKESLHIKHLCTNKNKLQAKLYYTYNMKKNKIHSKLLNIYISI